MKFKQLLEKYHEEETPIQINGMPNMDGEGVTEDQMATISDMQEDYLTITLINKTEKQQDTTKETIHIPYNQIYAVTEGTKKAATLETVTEKNKKDKKEITK